jgi:hypothetical protein
VVQDFSREISLSFSSASCGSFQKSDDWVIFSSSRICSIFPSMSKMPPQRLLALHQLLDLLIGDHDCGVCMVLWFAKIQEFH